MNALTPIEAAERPVMTALTWDGDKAPLAKAFVAAQKAMEGIKKAATNPAFKSKYADLAHVVEGVTPALNEAGVGVLQFPSYDGDLVGVTTTLLHESGSSVTGTLHLRPTKSDPQGCGSAITYARRYALLAITGCAPEDDDGNAASQRHPLQNAAPARLSAAQLAEVEDLIEKSGAAPTAILQAYAVRALADIPAEAFQKLRAQLQARIAKNQQKDAE
jgi:hypothetical protein